ncbi:MAG: DUF3052 domain-containing protein [Acidobacteriota bacterium]
MAGYSGTPLPKKLGIKEGHRVVALRAPDDFSTTLGALPVGVSLTTSLRGTRPFDVIVSFHRRLAGFERDLVKLKGRLVENGGLWIAWPKKSSGLQEDLTEADVRRLGLAIGLVDNKICAVDETWSGLRFVYRVKDRSPTASKKKASKTQSKKTTRRR